MLHSHRALIVDMTHGGKLLAQELKKKCEVIGIDIYNTMERKEITYFEKQGIIIKKSLNEMTLKNDDLIIVPVHCNPDFISKAIEQQIKIVSFHKIIGDLLRSHLTNKFIIEITGTRGKTTTAITLAELLSYQKKVLCLSSRGLELFQHGKSKCLKRDVEIAPPYLLCIKKFLQDFDIGIFEVSLGGTGLADIGVLTNIVEDYPIANLTRTASHGKKQILELAKANSVIFYNNDDENSKKLVKLTKTNANKISFGESGQIKAKKPISNSFDGLNKLEIEYNFFYENRRMGKITSLISSKLIGPGYFHALLIYIGVALILKISQDKIINNLNRFNGISNRLSLSQIKNYWILKDINSGVGHLSLNAVLESINSYLIENNSKIWIILDTDSSVCEGISVEKIQNVILQWKEIIKEVYSKDSNIGKSFQNLNQILDNLDEKAEKNDIIYIAKKMKG